MPVDISKPSVSRIYDYVLGGHHNFEVDRVAAQKILQFLPSYPRWARFNRWFLQLIAARWAQENHTAVLDLGSGLPTQGHFHDAIPTAKVVYTDFDPVTVAYALEVLGDNPMVRYLQADIRQPEAMLAEAHDFFDGNRRVAIGFIGIAYFLDDAHLTSLIKSLHDWAEPGSILALSFIDGDRESSDMQQILDVYRKNAASVYIRHEHEIQELLSPWKHQESRPLVSWLNMESMLQDSDREKGANVSMIGSIFTFD